MSGVELFALPAIGKGAATVVTLADALTVAGGVIGAASSMSQAKAQASQANYQSEVLRQQAQQDRERARLDEEDFRRQQSRMAAARRAALGASGIEGGTGSSLLVAEDFAGEAELGALRIRHGGAVSATRREQSAELQRFSGRNALRAGKFRAGASLLSGAVKAFG